MNNRIELKFDKTLKVLAGNPFGREIFEAQIMDKFKMDEKNELIFPKEIKVICSSFVQGLFSKFLEKFSPEEILSKIIVSDTILYENIRQGLYD